MNIPVKSLQRFQKLASHVRQSNVIPIHGYLKFGNGKIIKNINTAFIITECPEATEEVLIPENDLFGLLSGTVGEFVSLSVKKNKVEFNDGRDKFTVQVPKVSEFVEPPITDKEGDSISGEFLDALYKASHFAKFVKDQPTYYGYVHVGEKSVCAGDGLIAVHTPIEEEFKFTIEGSLAKMISQQDVHSFCIYDNFYYFKSDKDILGFAKSIIGWSNMAAIFKNDRQFRFSLDASDVTSFNALALKLSKLPFVTYSNGLMYMNDSEEDKYQERQCEQIKVSEEFTFNPALMNTLIAGFNQKELDFSEAKPCYFISSKDSKSTTIIAKIQKQ